MSPSRKKLLLGLGLAATIVLVWFAPSDDSPPAKNATAKRVQRAPTAVTQAAKSGAAAPSAPASGATLMASAARAGPSDLLTRGDRIMTVSIGQVIDNAYRVEGIGGGQVTFVYLPRDIKQTLSTGVTQ